MPEITDLDVLVPDDKKVNLRGETYTVPGDMPLEIYLRVNRAAGLQEAGANQSELLDSMVDAIVELFCWKVPEEDTERRDKVRGILMGLGLRTVTQILGKIYPADEDPDETPDLVEGDVVDPPTPGTTTS